MPSNHCDQLALHISVAVDVPLGRLDRAVPGEQLDISQRTTGFVHEPRRPGNKRPPSRMRRAAVQTDVPKFTSPTSSIRIGPHAGSQIVLPALGAASLASSFDTAAGV